MPSVEAEARVAAPLDQVWTELADFGNIYRWNPVVERSYLTSEYGTGVGAARHCDFRGRGYIEEQVLEWEEGRRLGVQVTRSSLPLEEAAIRFSLREENEGTRVRAELDYTPRWGLVGRTLDRVYGRRAYQRTMQSVVEGLKRHVESRDRLLRPDEHGMRR